MQEKKDKSYTAKFRMDFIRKGLGLIDKQAWTYASSKKNALNLFQRRPELLGYFQNPYLNWNIVVDQQWMDENPEQFARYRKHWTKLQDTKENIYQKRERIKNEKETKDRVFCPRCRNKLNIDSDFCENCGYPSEDVSSDRSWLQTALIEEGKKPI